jgi:hypothetical protein
MWPRLCALKTGCELCDEIVTDPYDCRQRCIATAVQACEYESVCAVEHHLLTCVWLRRISPRPISTRQLHALPRFHPGPINLVFFQGSYILGNLILRRASRLDAFSAYPSRTWLPSGAPGGTTGTPAVRPSRSSRTKDSPSQISCARDR